jgi:hypothetical protein
MKSIFSASLISAFALSAAVLAAPTLALAGSTAAIKTPSASNSAPNLSPSKGGKSTGGAPSVQMTLQLSFPSTDSSRTTFTNQFKSDLSKALGISSDRIEVLTFSPS